MVRLIVSDSCVIEYNKKMSKSDRELLLGVLVDNMDADYNEAVTKVNEIADLASEEEVYEITTEQSIKKNLAPKSIKNCLLLSTDMIL